MEKYMKKIYQCIISGALLLITNFQIYCAAQPLPINTVKCNIKKQFIEYFDNSSHCVKFFLPDG